MPTSGEEGVWVEGGGFGGREWERENYLDATIDTLQLFVQSTNYTQN